MIVLYPKHPNKLLQQDNEWEYIFFTNQDGADQHTHTVESGWLTKYTLLYQDNGDKIVKYPIISDTKSMSMNFCLNATCHFCRKVMDKCLHKRGT